MRFRTRPAGDDPDINFIPLIDVLLVIVIFLAVSTTFSKERVIDVLLPQAQTQTEMPSAIDITISADGQVAVGQRVLTDVTVEALTAAIASLASSDSDQVVIIRADANATHQAVVNAMQAARLAGIRKLSLAAQVAD
jgi:biopolymer transport protein ExbD